MFRTRDFILVFTTAFFLVIAIGVTTLHQFLRSPVASTGELRPSTSLIEDYTVETTHSESSREAAIESLRNKITVNTPVISMPETTSESSEPVIEDVAQEPSSDAQQLCSGFYNVSSVAWVPQDTYWQQVEGARILFERPYVEVPSTAITSSSSLQVKDIARLQLPLVTIPVSNPACIPTDVVGVALDGSLMRNGEASLYSVFGSETIIGYALDGFPIYGVSTERSDLCGGRIVSGQYRYELSSKRATLLNCFSGTPQTPVYGNIGS